MDKEKRQRLGPPLAVGGSSLLIIFAVLCLTVLAMLSLSSANSSHQLSLASVRNVEAYYAADAQAEEIFARLCQGLMPEGVTAAGDGVYEYTVPISQTQVLSVAVGQAEGEWTVLRWQAVSTADWEPDDGLLVWDGEGPPF